MIVREFDVADRPAALALMQQNTKMPMDELAQLLEQGQRWVALQNGTLRGFAVLAPGRPGNYSCYVIVDCVARRQGIGESLWQQLLASLPINATQVSAGCPSTDIVTRAWLAARGFQPWYSLELMHYSGLAFPDAPLTVRPYRDEDYEVWIDLINDGFYPMRQAMDIQPYRIYSEEAKCDPATREKMLHSGDDDDLLFYDGEQLVGMAVLVKGEIETITVAGHLRQHGYGRRIMAHCTNLMLARGINPVTLHVVSWNADARRLYESMGWRFVEQRDVLRWKLGLEQK